jgi:heme exporter protein D
MLRNSKIFLWNDLVSFPFLIIAYWMAASKGLLSVALVTTAFRLVKTVIVQNKALQLARQARLEGEETQTLSVAAL